MKYIKDSKGEESLTATLFIIGAIITLIKFALGGLVIGPITIPVLSGMEFSAALTALGGIYVLRRIKGVKHE
jgi:hypothetical protein